MKTAGKQKVKKTRRKEGEYRQQIKELDELWKSVVLLKAGRQCEVCGSENHVQAHHAFPREILSTRFDDRNGVALCLYHHITGRYSAHRNPIYFVRWMEDNRMDDLAEIEARVSDKVNKSNLQFEEKKNKLEDMKAYLETLLT